MKKLFAFAILLMLQTCGVDVAFAKTWDLNAPDTEAAQKRAAFAKSAGTLRSYVEGKLTDSTYHMDCCGEGDLYEADDYDTDEKGNLWAILTCYDADFCKPIASHEQCATDEESDDGAILCSQVGGKLGYPSGTRILIPPEKMLVNKDPVNLTGHGWVFMNGTGISTMAILDGKTQPTVYCYTLPGGN